MVVQLPIPHDETLDDCIIGFSQILFWHFRGSVSLAHGSLSLSNSLEWNPLFRVWNQRVKWQWIGKSIVFPLLIKEASVSLLFYRYGSFVFDKLP